MIRFFFRSANHFIILLRSKKLCYIHVILYTRNTMKNIRNMVTLVAHHRKVATHMRLQLLILPALLCWRATFSLPFIHWVNDYDMSWTYDQRKLHACTPPTRINIIISCLRTDIEILASVLLACISFSAFSVTRLVPFNKSYMRASKDALGSIWTPLWEFFVRGRREMYTHFSILMYVER